MGHDSAIRDRSNLLGRPAACFAQIGPVPFFALLRPGFFTVFSQTRPDKLDEVVTRIQQNIARAKAGKISREEFRTAVQMITPLHAQANTTIAAQARQAALDDLYGLGYAYDKTFDARIEAVKLDDVVRVARKYLNNYVLVTTSPKRRSAEVE